MEVGTRGAGAGDTELVFDPWARAVVVLDRLEVDVREMDDGSKEKLSIVPSRSITVRNSKGNTRQVSSQVSQS